MELQLNQWVEKCKQEVFCLMRIDYEMKVQAFVFKQQ